MMTSQLTDLYGRLSRRVEIADAVLNTIEVNPAAQAARRGDARADLANAATDLRGYLNSIPNGKGWVKYLRVDAVSNPESEVKPAELNSVRDKLKGKNQLGDPKSRSFLTRPRIAAYEAAVDGYLAAATAPADPNGAEIRKDLQNLVTAIEQYEAAQTKPAATALRQAFDAVRQHAADGGAALTDTLSSNYLNYNLRIVATESFVNKLVAQRRQENGPVVDCILGANVDGCQTTVTDVSVNLVPSANDARFDLTLQGQTTSNTQGVTNQATIYTIGNHTFTARKGITFDGDRFSTSPAQVWVNPHNYNTDAVTNFSRIPLFGRIADNIAIRKANELRPEAEAIAASRLVDRVQPQFNAEVDRQFGPNGTANRDFQAKVISKLRENDLYPDYKHYSTTEDELRIRTRLMDDTELGGGAINPGLVSGDGLTVRIHDSLINNSLDNLGLQGRTMSEDDLRVELETHLSNLLGKPVSFSPPPKNEEGDKGPNVLVFDQNDPIRMHSSNGYLNLTVRAGFKQEGKDDIPEQIITVPLKFSVDGDKVIVERGSVQVSPAGEVTSRAKQISTAGVIKGKFEDAFERREMDRNVDIKRDANTKVRAKITQIVPADGWLTILVD
jgi:hypothetical protein